MKRSEINFFVALMTVLAFISLGVGVVSGYPIVEPSSGGGVKKESANYPVISDDNYTIAATTVGVATSNLALGFYIVQTSADVFCAQGTVGVTAATTDRLIKLGSVQPMAVKSTSLDALACITASGTATVYISRDDY